MRAVTTLTVALLVAATGCSSEPPSKPLSANVRAWKAGDAVVVLVADAKRDPANGLTDYTGLSKRPGVIAVWSVGETVHVSMSRQAMLVDLAALRLELERTPGLSNIRQTVVPPG